MEEKRGENKQRKYCSPLLCLYDREKRITGEKRVKIKSERHKLSAPFSGGKSKEFTETKDRNSCN